MLCVLGKQWAARVVSLPPGKTELERTLAHEQRKALAEGKLIPLMGVLFWTLLLSITLFIIGLLIQLWALAFSCSKPAFILVVAAALGSGLSVLILGIILATTYHASIHDNSPFESPLSSAMRPVLKWLNAHLQQSTADADAAVAKQSGGDKVDEGGLEDVPDDGTPYETKTIEKLMKIRDNDSENVKALKTFSHLVINTNDPEVLERAAPSFEFSQWQDVWDEQRPVFLAVRGRFLTTDTSIRVKETVHKQLVYFQNWTGWRDDEGDWKSDLPESGMTQWCKEECERLVQRSRESRQEFFSSWLFFVSFQKDNADLRFWPDATDSYEKCVCRVLSTFDQKRSLGDRSNIFLHTVRECRELIRNGSADDVIRMIGRDRFSFFRSIIRSPELHFRYFRELVPLLTEGNEEEVLSEMAEFLSNLSMRTMRREPDVLLEFLAHFIPSLSENFRVPPSLDFSPAISIFLDQRTRLNSYDQDTGCKAFMYYLDHGGFECLSKLESVVAFFKFCAIDYTGENDTEIRERAKWHLDRHHPSFVRQSLFIFTMFLLVIARSRTSRTR